MYSFILLSNAVKHEETTGTGRISKVWADIYSGVVTCSFLLPHCSFVSYKQ